jgi:adenosylcobinamide-GDP ribazoletransferase
MPEESDSGAALPLGDWWEDFRTSVAFLTRLPIGTQGDSHAGALARASRTFPLAGLVVGAIAGAAYWIAIDLGLTALISATLAVAAGIVATGALHEDGLADFADGLGVRGDRQAKLAAMRDSRIGVFGMLALALGLLLRILALGALAQPAQVFAALLAVHAGARALLPWVMHHEGLARQDGFAVTAGRPSRATAIAALILGGLLLLVALGLAGALAAALGAALALLLVPLARRQLGGVTGDVLGAIEQLAEIFILLAVVAAR